MRAAWQNTGKSIRPPRSALTLTLSQRERGPFPNIRSNAFKKVTQLKRQIFGSNFYNPSLFKGGVVYYSRGFP